jgi:hypothetical protein
LSQFNFEVLKHASRYVIEFHHKRMFDPVDEKLGEENGDEHGYELEELL